MYGAILGDIIGSPYEFDQGEKIKNFPLLSEKSRFTDDTVMTIAIADVFLHHDPYVGEEELKIAIVNSMRKWGNVYGNVGYGGMFYRWLRMPIPNPKPYGSYGNGSAMRVSPVAWIYEDIGRTREVARWSAEVTHNHPEGIKGAEAVASVIYLTRTGKTKAYIKQYIQSEFSYNLDTTCDDIRPWYSMDATCQGSVPEAIVSFLEGKNYEDCVRNAVSLGGDTDTLGCMTGGMAEAKYAIPEELKEEANIRLDSSMIIVLERFYSKFVKETK